MGIPWKASETIFDLVNTLKEQYHPRLETAEIAVCFDDVKPFKKDKLNLGKVVKFNPLAKIYQHKQYSFCIVIPVELWTTVLKDSQKTPYLDLQLSRCEVEYEEEVVEVNGKKQKVKDEFGRVKYTSTFKFDVEGNPKWRIVPLDLEIFARNIRRHGVWLEEFCDLKEAIDAASA